MCTRFGVATLILLAASLGPAASPAHAGCTDADADGYFFESGCSTLRDCNDAEATIHPDAVEACDGYDNDCDGVLDQDCDGGCIGPAIVGAPRTIASLGAPTAVGRAPLVWSGTEFGVVWSAEEWPNYPIYFARLDSAGNKIGPDHVVGPSNDLYTYPALVWTGAEYGVAWTSWPDPDQQVGGQDIYFARLDPAGDLLSGPDLIVPASAAGVALVWTGSEYGLAWPALLAEGFTIKFRRLDAQGQPIGLGQSVTALPGGLPVLVWNGTEYGLAWVAEPEIWFLRLDAAGAPIDTEIQVRDPGAEQNPGQPSLVWAGDQWGLAWEDRRDSQPGAGEPIEIYFARLEPDGDPIGPNVRVTNASGASVNPTLAWSGSRFTVGWTDYRPSYNHKGEAYVARIDAAGGKVGSDVRLSDDHDTHDSVLRSLAWHGTGFAVAWKEDFPNGGPNPPDDEIRFARVGCCDVDGDTFTECMGDCDELDSLRFPGAFERCNGLDDDCDGTGDVLIGIDDDGDDADDGCDNCLALFNPLQVDKDKDTLGNACDNCVFAYNLDQADGETDGIGDSCDNCPSAPNSLQENADLDAAGDACDGCPLTFDPSPRDGDGDGQNDACDPDDGLIYIVLGPTGHAEWFEETGYDAWNLYEGDLAVLLAGGEYTQSAGDLAQRTCGLAEPSGETVDVPAGMAAFSLVTGVADGVESDLGQTSWGQERPNTNPCP